MSICLQHSYFGEIYFRQVYLKNVPQEVRESYFSATSKAVDVDKAIANGSGGSPLKRLHRSFKRMHITSSVSEHNSTLSSDKHSTQYTEKKETTEKCSIM